MGGDNLEDDPYFKERRASTRIRRHGHIEIKHHGSDNTFKSQIMNVSEGGIRFISAIAFELGETVDFTMDGQEITAVVLECKNLYNGYAIRAEFSPED